MSAKTMYGKSGQDERNEPHGHARDVPCDARPASAEDQAHGDPGNDPAARLGGQAHEQQTQGQQTPCPSHGWRGVLHRRMPSREAMAGNRWLAPIAHRFLGPQLWRFTRRSVPRGVALGLFCGFIVPVGQIFLAAFLALPARANVPVAALTTFITNPLTIPFWIVVANRVGRWTLRIDPTGLAGQLHARASMTHWDSLVWFAQSAGMTAVGFLVLAVGSSVAGYTLSSLGWRLWVVHKRTAARRTQV